jgi:hypothetical protein
MYTDNKQPALQGAISRGFLPKQEMHTSVGRAFEDLNELGHGPGLTLNFKHSRLD